MITDALINLGAGLIGGIVSILPNSTGFSGDVLSAAHTIGSYFGLVSPILPIDTIATAVTVVFTIEIAIFGWKTIKSLISHIPQFGGSGH